MIELDQHQTKGIRSELLAQDFFISKGYIVSKPLNDSCCRYDLIIDKDSKIKKVQVKSIFFDKSRNRYLCKLFTNHRKGHSFNGKHSIAKYTLNDFDMLCAVSIDLRILYFIPINLVENKQVLYFNPTSQANRNKSIIYEDFKHTI